MNKKQGPLSPMTYNISPFPEDIGTDIGGVIEY